MQSEKRQVHICELHRSTVAFGNALGHVNDAAVLKSSSNNLKGDKYLETNCF